MLPNAKTKGRDAVEQPKGFNHKLLILKEVVAVTGDIKRDGPAWSLLWVWRTTLCCHLKRETPVKTTQISEDDRSVSTYQIANGTSM